MKEKKAGDGVAIITRKDVRCRQVKELSCARIGSCVGRREVQGIENVGWICLHPTK